MGGGKRDGRQNRYPVEYKVRVVKTALEKKLTPPEVEQVYGVSRQTYHVWKRRYRTGGEAALEDRPRGKNRNADGKAAVHPKLREQILAVKQQHPCFGSNRILHWIRRTLFTPIRFRQVHTTLREENLLQKRVVRRKRATWKPQSFERAKPNHLWQSDITIFTITGGLKVYLIGFLDDHSRYMAGWGLYAGQSGKLVLEVLRRAIATYGRPLEILTDNGRQYKSWHGETDFQRELKREGIKHITSRPHHPQTLGKIESFWGHMKKEWLAQVVMGDLDSMRERLGHWINYYNFQRPHTGIGNTAPAERYFQYGEALKAEVEKRIAANERELSLADPAPRLIGQMPMGEDDLTVRKDGTDFVVLLDGVELNRTDLNPHEETSHEAQKDAAGPNGGDGRAGESEGRDGAGGALGREADLEGVPGNGAQAATVLQAGGEDGPGDAGGGPDTGRVEAGTGAGSGNGGDGGGDGDAAAGAPADEESGAGVAEAAGAGGGEKPQIRAPEGQTERVDAGAAGDAGGPAPSGTASGAGDGGPAGGPEGGVGHGREGAAGDQPVLDEGGKGDAGPGGTDERARGGDGAGGVA
jgi:transposase InsO family protein